MIPIATARELAGAVRLAYCLPSVFYLKCDFRLPKTLHQETETARAHTVRLAARPPQKHREPQTCTRPERSAGQNDRGTQSRRRRKQELKGHASRNPKRPSSTGAPSSTQREPARQAGLGGGGWWVQTCRAHVALCTVTVLVYGSFIITPGLGWWARALHVAHTSGCWAGLLFFVSDSVEPGTSKKEDGWRTRRRTEEDGRQWRRGRT